MITEKLKSKSCGEISCDQCNDERLDAANKIEYLLIQNLRLQLDLDASCNAEELRQVRAENAKLLGLLSEVFRCVEYAERCGGLDTMTEIKVRRALSALPNAQADS